MEAPSEDGDGRHCACARAARCPRCVRDSWCRAADNEWSRDRDGARALVRVVSSGCPAHTRAAVAREMMEGCFTHLQCEAMVVLEAGTTHGAPTLRCIGAHVLAADGATYTDGSAVPPLAIAGVLEHCYGEGESVAVANTATSSDFDEDSEAVLGALTTALGVSPAVSLLAFPLSTPDSADVPAVLLVRVGRLRGMFRWWRGVHRVVAVWCRDAGAK